MRWTSPLFAAAHRDGGVVVDVREPFEYAAGHVPGATLMPMAAVRARLRELPRSRPVYVICATGNRSLTRRGADGLGRHRGMVGDRRDQGLGRGGRAAGDPGVRVRAGKRGPAMIEVVGIDTPALGDRSYLATDGRVALVVDPQRDMDRLLAAAAGRGVHAHVFETHIHNDYVSGRAWPWPG